jgi:hypothetical protein
MSVQIVRASDCRIALVTQRSRPLSIGPEFAFLGKYTLELGLNGRLYRGGTGAPEVPSMPNLQRLRDNFRAWLAGVGEVEILFLLDSIADELEARGRPFPVEIPCFREFGSHRLSLQ